MKQLEKVLEKIKLERKPSPISKGATDITFAIKVKTTEAIALLEELQVVDYEQLMVYVLTKLDRDEKFKLLIFSNEMQKTDLGEVFEYYHKILLQILKNGKLLGLIRGLGDLFAIDWKEVGVPIEDFEKHDFRKISLDCIDVLYEFRRLGEGIVLRHNNVNLN